MDVWNGIWGSGPTDVYAVASGGTIAHTTGNGQWVSQSSGTNAILYGVWGSGPGDVYVAPYINTILHSTGDGTWQHEGQPAGNTFHGIWGSGPNDVYACGGGAIHSTGGGVWEMPGQEITQNGQQGEPIRSMWGSSSTDIYASGSVTDIYHSKGDGNWVPVLKPQSGPLAVSGSGATDVYAIGNTSVYHSTGDGKWTQQTVPLTGSETLYSVWVLRKDAVYLGTTKSRVCRSGGDGRWVVQELDPKLNGAAMVSGFWGSSATNLYAATTLGIYHGKGP
jgi:hypothetical protein